MDTLLHLSRPRNTDNDLMSSNDLSLIKSNNLQLDNLQRKPLLLLVLSTIGRPRSDAGKFQYRDVHFQHDEDGITGVTILARQPKKITSKSSKVGRCAQCTLLSIYLSNSQPT